MTVNITGTLTDNKFARILHAGNAFSVKTVSASQEVANYPGSAANAWDTVDRWRPFENEADSPSNFATGDWSLDNVTIGSDAQTIAETTSNSQHRIVQNYSFPTFSRYIVSFKIKRQTVPQVRIVASNGSDVFAVFFNLIDKTVGSGFSTTDGRIVDLGNDILLLSINFLSGPGAGSFQLRLADGSESDIYAGSTTNTVKVLDAAIHRSSATLRFDTFVAQEANCVAIAAHNIGTAGGLLTIQHDSNNNDTFTDIATITQVPDNSPIMFFFEGITSSRWQLQVNRGVLPEIGVLKIGKALKMERPFYAGYTPARMSRNTEVLGNLSGSGELLGRSKKRTTLNFEAQWNNLTYEWVRANLDGKNGTIQSVEDKPLFISWRPGLTNDVAYVMRAQTQPPQAIGTRNLWSFGLSGEAYGYE